MILKNEEGKLTFIIDTLCSISFENKGGSIVVHKLAYELANLGHQVYVFNNPFYPHENISIIPTIRRPKDDGWWSEFVWESFEFDLYKTISIYTQVTWGNPFGTKYNCRWILHDYDEQQWSTFTNEDLIYNFAFFKVPSGTTQQKLTTFDYKLEIFKNIEKERNGYCYILHKFTPDWGYEFLKNFGATNLTQFLLEGKFIELSEEFNKYEYLLTFDYKSYITTAAALCGCKVVIMNPNQNTTPLQFRIENPIQMCGVAYGWDDLEWANQTIHLVKKNLYQLQKMDKLTIINFINFWENKLLNK